MDSDAPMLIRNVSQSLTAAVSHSLGQKRKYSLLTATKSLKYSHTEHADVSTVTLKWDHSWEEKLWCVVSQAKPVCEVD